MSDAAGEEDDAARAFEALREEVASLRSGIERVYQQGQEAKSVDYSLTLGQMAKTLQGLQGRLAAIEGKPALEMTPAIYRTEIAEAGRIAAEMAGRILREGAEAQSAATRELREVTGQARAAQEQRRWLTTVGAIGVVVGLGLWAILVNALPWGAGTWLASLPLAGGNRWEAGQQLMRAADPVGFDRIVKLSQACGDQQVDLCAAVIAVKTAEPPGQGDRTPAAATPARTRQVSRP
jgi:hypothetical protein